MKKLPIGIQSFEEIIIENYIYVDKTEYIYNLTSQGKDSIRGTSSKLYVNICGNTEMK